MNSHPPILPPDTRIPMQGDLSLNPSPRWSVPLRQNLRGLLDHRRFWLPGALFIFSVTSGIAQRIQDARSGEGVEPGAPIPQGIVEALRSSGEYVPVLRDSAVVSLCFIGVLLWSGMVWAGLAFGKRDYLLSLPVNRPAHELWRVGAGAIWLVVALLVLFAIGGGFTLLEGIPLFPAYSWPYWISFFAVPLSVYLLVSIAVVSSRSPGLWIFGCFSAIVLLRLLDVPPVNRVLQLILGSDTDSPVYGFFQTLRFGYTTGVEAWVMAYSEASGLTGPFTFGRATLTMREPGAVLQGWPSTWLLSLALWMAIICTGLYLAARRKA